MDINELGAVFVTALYNFAVLAGCAYLVTKHGWSPWWFLLAVLCLKSIKTGAAAVGAA